MSTLAFASLAASLLFTLTPAIVDDDHIVVPGDTLSRIAKDYDVSVRELVEANDLDDPLRPQLTVRQQRRIAAGSDGRGGITPFPGQQQHVAAGQWFDVVMLAGLGGRVVESPGQIA